MPADQPTFTWIGRTASWVGGEVSQLEARRPARAGSCHPTDHHAGGGLRHAVHPQGPSGEVHASFTLPDSAEAIGSRHDRAWHEGHLSQRLHLGHPSRHARSEDGLPARLPARQASCEQLYLVGDIVDGWRLRKSWYWDEAHDEVLRLILARARAGAAVTYVPGNHDEMLRNWLPLGLEIAGVRLACRGGRTCRLDGRRLLVIHGDQFDSVVRYAKFLALLGDQAYTVALAANRCFNLVRRRFGYPYWSLSQWLKRQVKGAVAAIDRFEEALARHARNRGFDGVICGHIHHPEMRSRRGRAVHQRRRLGRELHRAGRAPRRPARADRVAGAEQRHVRAATHDRARGDRRVAAAPPGYGSSKLHLCLAAQRVDGSHTVRDRRCSFWMG